MGLLDNLMGNATEVKASDVQTELSSVLCDGEQVERAFKVFRDQWIFTTKRLIILDVQGVTGSKKDYHSIPYKSVQHFSVETSGTFDDDCEMKIWVAGQAEPIKQEFSTKIDIKALQLLFANHVLLG